MKLLTVLMLIALPLSCFASSGCEFYENMVSDMENQKVDIDQFVNTYAAFIEDESVEKALGELKTCYLMQSEDTVANAKLLMETIYNSAQCAAY